MEKFFIQDLVALKADPSIRAIVCATWRDNESVDPETEPDDWINHKDVPYDIFEQMLARGKPVEGYAVIAFPSPRCGRTLVAESSLVLLDRALFVGDLVKQDLSSVQSGTVTNTKVKSRIRPVYTDLPYQGFVPWPHRAEDNELWVPSEELRFDDHQPGDFIAYKNWIGEIVHVQEEVTLCLGNGSVVRVRNPEELEMPYWGDVLRGPYRKRMSTENTLLESLEFAQRKVEEATKGEAMGKFSSFQVGSKVFTKKSNLRLGHWVIGSYSASQPARGVVVESRVIGLDVDWITTNVYDHDAASQSPPPSILTTDEMNEVKQCTTGLPKSPYGSRIAREKMVADLCRFKLEKEAELKYAEGSPHGYFRHIPRTITQGFNMNVFKIVESQTEVEVEWQDGSKTWQSSKKVVPYPVVDDHDMWPGEIVSMKTAQVEADGLIRATKLGVVQSVDASDRVAEVRWYKQPDVQCFANEQGTLVPGSRCGELSEESSSVSLYDLYAYTALSRQRGDIVIIRPSDEPSRPSLSGVPGIVSSVLSQLGLSSDAARLPTETSEGYPWVGEVVNVSLDGRLTIRLGALQLPQDVEADVDEVDLLLSPDDEDSDDGGSYTDEEMASEFSEYSENDTVEPLEETIIYEGGSRLDDGEEDAWKTDSSGSEDDRESQNGDDEMHEDPAQVSLDDTSHNGDAEMTDVDDLESDIHPNPAPVEENTVATSGQNQAEYQFNEYESMPPQFQVLDENPPENHHFFSHNHTWTSPGMLRRIRKEHKLLQSSLPRGIWVRTWADRLDLLRILIIGPQGTPYSLAPFVLDFAFGNGYPKAPPEAYFHSWTNSIGKINPNLYEDGTVCLSVLGTWPESHDHEAWNTEHSSMLQVLVSLLGLVLVERPYYNEAGFEDMQGKEEALVNERVYSEKALVMAKGFVVHALKHDIQGVGDVIDWVYRSPRGPRLLQRVVNEARKLREGGNEEDKKLSRGALMLLERYLPVLEDIEKSFET